MGLVLEYGKDGGIERAVYIEKINDREFRFLLYGEKGKDEIDLRSFTGVKQKIERYVKGDERGAMLAGLVLFAGVAASGAYALLTGNGLPLVYGSFASLIATAAGSAIYSTKLEKKTRKEIENEIRGIRKKVENGYRELEKYLKIENFKKFADKLEKMKEENLLGLLLAIYPEIRKKFEEKVSNLNEDVRKVYSNYRRRYNYIEKAREMLAGSKLDSA